MRSVKHYNVGEKNAMYGKTGALSPSYGKSPSKETRHKISVAQKNRVFSPETIAKMSIAQRKRFENPEEHKKLSDAWKYRTVSPETRAKMSAFHKKKHENPEERRKLQVYLQKFYETPSGREKMRDCHRGENNGRWLGGISFEPYCPKFNKDLKRRIRAFFDNRCVLCGKPESENGRQHRKLSCHHVEYNKSACCDGKPVHFAALCMNCHVHTNLDRERWEDILHKIIDEIYDGRSYYTKDEWERMNKCQS
jgi:hypothetical protein